MRVCLVGATGNISTSIVKLLLELDHEVTVFNRGLTSGMPAGAAPQAPPDNVLLLPLTQWRELFDAQARVRPDSVRTQLHVRGAHDLPAAPEAAYATVTRRANNLEARLAGSGRALSRTTADRTDSFRARLVGWAQRREAQ